MPLVDSHHAHSLFRGRAKAWKCGKQCHYRRTVNFEDIRLGKVDNIIETGPDARRVFGSSREAVEISPDDIWRPSIGLGTDEAALFKGVLETRRREANEKVPNTRVINI